MEECRHSEHWAIVRPMACPYCDCEQALELDSSQEFDHASSVGAPRLSKGCALDVGAGIGIAVGDWLQLENVEDVEGIYLRLCELVGQLESADRPSICAHGLSSCARIVERNCATLTIPLPVQALGVRCFIGSGRFPQGSPRTFAAGLSGPEGWSEGSIL